MFVLAELGEMRGSEIAEALAVNPNTVYARLRSARTDLDRIARRLRAKDAPTLARNMREHRPSERARRRTWAAIVAKLPTVAAAGAAGAGALTWGIVGGLAGALLLVTVGRERNTAPGLRRRRSVRATRDRERPARHTGAGRPRITADTRRGRAAGAGRHAAGHQARGGRTSAQPTHTSQAARGRRGSGGRATCEADARRRGAARQADPPGGRARGSENRGGGDRRVPPRGRHGRAAARGRRAERGARVSHLGR